MIRLFFILLNVIASSSNQKVWRKHEKHEYFVSRESVNHSDATSRCNQKNAHLVDVSNHAIQEFLENIIKNLSESKLIFYYSTIIYSSYSSSSSFEGHPLQARHKQNWGRGFILLLPQTAALPGSDAGSDVIKPASSFVIQNRQTACSMWCPMYGAHC